MRTDPVVPVDLPTKQWAESRRQHDVGPAAEAPVVLVRPEHAARERLAYIGLSLLSIGAGAVYWPAGLILPGLYLLIVTWPRRPRPVARPRVVRGGADHG